MILLTEIIKEKLEKGMETLEKANTFLTEYVLPFTEWITNNLWFVAVFFVALIIYNKFIK